MLTPSNRGSVTEEKLKNHPRPYTTSTLHARFLDPSTRSARLETPPTILCERMSRAETEPCSLGDSISVQSRKAIVVTPGSGAVVSSNDDDAISMGYPMSGWYDEELRVK